MAPNHERRDLLADAGLALLASTGQRGLTHRAVDRAAGVPDGTTANYWRTRAALTRALAERILERLQPDPAVLDELEARDRDLDLYVAYMDDIAARVLADPELWIALLELRLEARRDPAVAEALGELLRRGFRADVAYGRGRGFPVGEVEVQLMHHAMNGLLLEALTPSVGGPLDTSQAIDALTRRVVGGSPDWRDPT